MDRARAILVDYLLRWYPARPSVVAVRALLLFGAALVVFTLVSRVSYEGQPGGSPSGALVALLGRQGIAVDEGSVHWLEPPGKTTFSDLAARQAVLLAGTREEPLRDFYLARVRLTPGGKAAAAQMWNLSDTPFCGEEGLWARGRAAAVACWVPGGFSTVTFFDFDGESPALVGSLPLVEKVKNAVTNYQKTGRLRGAGQAFLEFRKPQAGLSIEIDGDTFVVSSDEATVRVSRRGGTFLAEGVDGGTVEFHPAEKAISGHVAWIVDTARDTELIGKEKVGWAEAKWYRIEDFFKRNFYKVAGSGYATESIKDDMGPSQAGSKTLKAFLAHMKQAAIPDITPPPVKPMVNLEPVAGEGTWTPILDDIFTLNDPDAPPSLYRTFLRPDAERPYAFAHMVAWDPRMVELHVVAGAVEPKSETGRAGSGMIPRDDETLLRLLAGFNGGFQALHGEFGLMQEGKVYLPPKPWAATVAILKGGRIGFGTWPGPEAGPIPPEILSYRQNLTPLIMDAVINPYKRSWWGSSPDLNPDSPSIARSGICWTASNHVVYGLAYSVDENTFAETMKHLGCQYLIQLDVNAGHSGFEFIRAVPEKDAPPLTRPLEGKWEAQGKLKDMESFLFRSKKLFKSMALMRFPRYTGKEPRDFFYITLTRNLPGPALAPGKGEAGPWNLAVPGNGFPPSFAFTTVHVDERTAVKIVRVDPRWIAASLQPGGGDGFPGDAVAILALPSSVKVGLASGADASFTEGQKTVVLGFDALGDEWRVLAGEGRPEGIEAFDKVITLEIPQPGAVPTAGAFGIGPSRFFAWAECADGDPAVLEETLRRAGASEVIFVPAAPGESVGWSFVSTKEGAVKLMPLLEKSGPVPAQPVLVLAPGGHKSTVRLFPDTTVVMPKVWNPPQVKRIRYFKPEPDADSGASGDGE
jgi:hypothetical protein